MSIWHFSLKNAIFNRGLLWGPYSAAFFLGKYGPFFCYVNLLAFSSFVSRYFRATENFNNLSGPMFDALMFCFPAFGENVRFHSGFSFRIWAPVPWCFVFQHLALVCFRFFGLLWCCLGWPLGPAALVGLLWARERFFQIFGSARLRPTWSHECCPNAQKQAVFWQFVHKGRCAEIVGSDLGPTECNYFPVLFCEFRRAPFGPKWAD